MTIKDFGGRKFLLTLFLLILTFVLLMFNKINAEAYIQIVFALLALYTTTNALISKNEIKQ